MFKHWCGEPNATRKGDQALEMHFRASPEELPERRPAVVLARGLGGSSRYMLPIAEHLALDLQVYAPDLPGFGLSDKPGHALTIRELADARNAPQLRASPADTGTPDAR
jgi:pimeloyl-ACP methyl ester carboxylesterase